MWHDIKWLNFIASTLLGLCALALLATGARWLAQLPMFSLKVIAVDGLSNRELRHVNALTVRSTALPRIEGNYFSMNLDAVRHAFETVPWVRRASVRREWPNKLVVAVEELQPIGIWGDDGRLLSIEGDVFTANLAEAEEAGKLVEFKGPSGSEKEVVARFEELRATLAELKLKPQAIHLSERFSWSVKLNNGVVVKLGRDLVAGVISERMAHLARAYPRLTENLQGAKIESIDLRYPNGLAIGIVGQGIAQQSKP